jgi:hypothetical protein
MTLAGWRSSGGLWAVMVMVTLLLREVPDSNLGLDIGYPGWSGSWFFSVRPRKFWADALIKLWPLPSTSSPINWRRIILATEFIVKWTTKQSYGFGRNVLFWIVLAILFVPNIILGQFWSSCLRGETVTLVSKLQLLKERFPTDCMTSILDIDFYVNWKERLNSHSAQLAVPPPPPTVDIAFSLLAIPSAILFALCTCYICCMLLLGVLSWQTKLSGLRAT